MKTLKILGSTALASTLFVTGLHVNQADASATNINKTNATDIIKQIDQQKGNKPDLINYGQPQNHGDYYEVTTNNKSGVGGAGVTRLYKDGTVQHSDGQSFKTIGHYDQADTQVSQTTQQISQQTPNMNQSNETSQTLKTLPDTGQHNESHFLTSVGTLLLIVGLSIISRRFTQNNH